MKRIVIGVLFAFAALATVPGTAFAQTPPPVLMRLVRSAIEATNTGDVASVATTYAPDAILVDEDAPFVWSGPGASRRWLAAVAKAIVDGKLEHFHGVARAPTAYDFSASRAYLVVPVLYTGTVGAKTSRETGTFAFVFARSNGAWRITDQTWATRAIVVSRV